jgi:hypothetical protein
MHRLRPRSRRAGYRYGEPSPPCCWPQRDPGSGHGRDPLAHRLRMKSTPCTCQPGLTTPRCSHNDPSARRRRPCSPTALACRSAVRGAVPGSPSLNLPGAGAGWANGQQHLARPLSRSVMVRVWPIWQSAQVVGRGRAINARRLPSTAAKLLNPKTRTPAVGARISCTTSPNGSSRRPRRVPSATNVPGATSGYHRPALSLSTLAASSKRGRCGRAPSSAGSMPTCAAARRRPLR